VRKISGEGENRIDGTTCKSRCEQRQLMAQGFRLARCSKSEAIWGTPGVLPTSSPRQPPHPKRPSEVTTCWELFDAATSGRQPVISRSSVTASILGRNQGPLWFAGSLAFRWLPNEDLHHPIGELIKIDGFPHPRRSCQHGRVSLMTTVAGDQNKRHFVAQEFIGHRR
jgi:hypothetical protein